MADLKDLIKTQVQVGESIEKIHVGYKKEPKQRLTIGRKLANWAEKLRTQWDLFVENHATLDARKDEIVDEPYFQQNYYSRIKLIFNAMNADIQLRGSFIEEVPTMSDELIPNAVRNLNFDNTSNSADASDDEGHNSIFADAKENLNNTIRNAHASTPLPNIADFDPEKQQQVLRFCSRLKTIGLQIEKLNSFLDEGQIDRAKCAKQAINDRKNRVIDDLDDICVLVGNFDSYYRNLFDEIEEKFYNANERLSKVSVRPMEPAKLHLQPIQIPTFSGTYKTWPAFNGIFTSLIINNQSLSDVQRMQYLKMNVNGEAGKLIAQLDIVEGNFEEAWKLLCQRFNNKRAILNAHFDIIFNLKTVGSSVAKDLRNILNNARECLALLKDATLDQAILFFILKLVDKTTFEQYEQSLKNTKDVQKLSEFLSFLETRCEILENIETQHGNNVNQKPVKSNYNSKPQVHDDKCVCCGDQHLIYFCPKFKNMSPVERRDFAKSEKLCLLCLRVNHMVASCKMKKLCPDCNGKHNGLLHLKEYEKKGNDKRSEKQTEKKKAFVITTELQSEIEAPVDTISCVVPNFDDRNDEFLATAQIRVKLENGWSEPIRVLIDQGSMASFISERLVNNLKLKKVSNNVCVTGIAGEVAEKSKGSVDLEFTSRYPSSDVIRTRAIVLNKLITTFDMSVANRKVIESEFGSLIFADPLLYKGTRIDILFGVDVIYDLMLNDGGLIKSKTTKMFAQETILGWTVTGSIKLNKSNSEESYPSQVISLTSTVDELNENIQRFWEIEEINVSRATLSEKDEQCMQHFNKAIKRDPTGRYIVSLPFKMNNDVLGNSKRSALAQFFHLERKFAFSPHVKQQYTDFIKEYIHMGHMERCVNVRMNDSECFYLPHHAVFKKSTTTEVRVVFDGSRKTSNGISLNDILLIGPRLQDDLFDIMLRFRLNRIAFSADVAKMYRQILVDEKHRDFQRILWRENVNEPIGEYRLTTVTYGTSPAPFLAVAAMQKHADNGMSLFPEACKRIKSDFYIDDLASGCHDIEDALKIQSEITAYMLEGGFPLRKWVSNSKEFLDNIPVEHRDGAPIDFKCNEELSVSTLGSVWFYGTDQFGFNVRNVSVVGFAKITKRKIFSEILKTYDPMGLLAPVTIANKLLMQSIWELDVNWDDSLLDRQEIKAKEIVSQWNKFCEQVPLLSNLRVNRWINFSPGCFVELHGFSDASKKAYAAVVYIKIKTGDSITVNVVASKTRVAPKAKSKTGELTLPRLELMGALLLSKLMTTVKRALKIPIDVTKYYSDANITLAWIKSDPNRWNVFVANRVSEIQKLTNPNDWDYVNTKCNPADCASRGLLPAQMETNNLWWYGPEWLATGSSKCDDEVEFETNIELRNSRKIVLNISVSERLIQRFSSFQKARRVIAYCLKFIDGIKLKKQNRKQLLTREQIECIYKSEQLEIEDLIRAKNVIIRVSQQAVYAKEVYELKSFGSVGRKSTLKSLYPFIDDQGLLRIGGRISQSNFSYDKKHPIIIPYGDHLVNLIIREAHYKALHGGNQLTLALIRHEYWIIAAKRAVKTVLDRCVTCRRFRAQTAQQLMGNLPNGRITPMIKIFTHTGTDLCGPIMLRMSRGRNIRAQKGYIVIFICLTTRLIHIEIVTDLTSEAFIAAFKRLTGRKGHVVKLYCDNGTNFVGAAKILELDGEDQISQFNENIKKQLLNEKTKFIFNPPGAPWMGGIWERNIGSIKYHLKRTIGDKILTYEELSTVLTQIEACLNSRPICPLTDNIDDLNVLTPAHFIIGDSLMAPIESDLTHIKENRLDRWQMCVRLKQEFWNQWSSDYINHIQPRSKWNEKCSNVKVGDLVLIKEENTTPLHWPLGRIVQTYPDQDGLVRVVDVKAKNKVFKRPIGKLSVLPIVSEEDSQNDSNLNKSQVHLDESVNDVIQNGVSQPVEAQLNKNKRGRKPKKGKSATSAGLSQSLLMTIILVFGLFASVFGNFTIIPFKNNPVVHFENCGSVQVNNDYWTIMSRMPFDEYTSQFVYVKNGIGRMEQMCNEQVNVSNCNLLVDIIKKRFDRIQVQNEFINVDLNRPKRAIFAIAAGTAVGTAVGFVGAKIYDWATGNNNLNSEDLDMLMEEQVSLFNMTTGLMEETDQVIEQDFQILVNQSKNMFSELRKSNKVMEFNHWLSMQLTDAIDQLNMLQNSIIKYLNNEMTKLDITLFDIEHMKSHLNIVLKKLPKGTRIVGDNLNEQISAIYQLATVQTMVMPHKLVFIVKIPLFRDALYECVNLNPIPIIKNDHFIEIDVIHNFVLINKTLKQVFVLTKEEWNKCKEYKNQKFCIENAIEYSSESDICAIELINQKRTNTCKLSWFYPKQFWQNIDYNRWIYSLQNETMATITCKSKNRYFNVTGSGILELGTNCVFKTEMITLETVGYVSEDEIKIHSSSLNFTYLNDSFIDEIKLISLPKPSDSALVREGMRSIDSVYHHLHHYVVNYTLIIGAIIFGIFFYFKFYFVKKVDHSYIIKA